MNSQMAPSLSQIRVLATLTMSGFALEAREELYWSANPWVLQKRRARIEKLPYGSLFRSDFAEVSKLLSSLSCFWTSVIEIEVLNEKDCFLLSMLYCKSLQKQIFPTFCNDFESHYRMFAYKENNLSPSMTSQGNAPFLVTTSFPGSSLFLPRESTLVAAGHVSMYTNQIRTGGGSLT